MNLTSVMKPITITIAVTGLAAGYLYFANMKVVIINSQIDSTLPAATAEITDQDKENLTVLRDKTPLPSLAKTSRELEHKAATRAKLNIRNEIDFDSETEPSLQEENGYSQGPQIDTPPPPPTEDNHLILAAENDLWQETEDYISVPSPTVDNMTPEATGEYADQINQQSIYAQAQADGLLIVSSDIEELIPSDKNIELTLGDELDPEVDQHEIVSRAELEAFQLPEVDPDTHPPTEVNGL